MSRQQGLVLLDRRTMDKEKVDTVVKICDELKKRAAAWEYAAYHDWKGNPQDYAGWAPKETGALRRISMELTRALADMRRK